VRRLGPNAYDEHLEPGRVSDCYLGILLDQPLAEIAPEPGSVLVVAPAALLRGETRQPDGEVLYDLVTRPPRPAAGGAGVPRRSHCLAARLATADLNRARGQPRRRPGGRRGLLA
jgi:hypothetical protein